MSTDAEDKYSRDITGITDIVVFILSASTLFLYSVLWLIPVSSYAV